MRFTIHIFFVLFFVSCSGEKSTGTRVGTETQIAFINAKGVSTPANFSIRPYNSKGWPWDSIPQAIYKGTSKDTTIPVEDSLFLEAYNADSSLATWLTLMPHATNITATLSTTSSYQIVLTFSSDTIIGAWYGFPGTGIYGQSINRPTDTLTIAHAALGTQRFSLYLQDEYVFHRLDFSIVFTGLAKTSANIPVDSLIRIAATHTGCLFQIDSQGLLATDAVGTPLCK